MEHTGHVSVAQDEGAVLLCVAQGCDSPEYRYVLNIIKTKKLEQLKFYQQNANNSCAIHV